MKSVPGNPPKTIETYEVEPLPKLKFNNRDLSEEITRQETQLVLGNTKGPATLLKIGIQEPDYLKNAGDLAHILNKLFDGIERSTQDLEMSSIRGSSINPYPQGSTFQDYNKANNSDSFFGNQKDRVVSISKAQINSRVDIPSPSSKRQSPVYKKREVPRSPQPTRAQMRHRGSMSPSTLPRVYK